MAIGLLKKNYETRVCHFVVDNETEIALLPNLDTKGQIDPLKTIYSCSMGSIAKIIGEDGVYYVLTGDNKWVKKTASSGGSGGGSMDDDYEFADTEDIDNLFKSGN